MATMPEIVSYLKYGRAVLFEAIAGLSRRELTKMEIYPGWTIKAVLAHIIGWDEQVIKNLALIKQGQADQIDYLNAEEQNQAAIARWDDKSWREVLTAVHHSYQQIVDMIAALDYPEIDRRYQRRGRVITIRSYIIETMVEHIRQHAAEIELWRQSLDADIDPAAIVMQLKQSRAGFMVVLDTFDEADVTNKHAIGHWSISDLVGHMADWEQRMLQATRHIYDPSLPPVPPVDDQALDWDEILVARRAKKSWPENHHDLLEAQVAVDNFLIDLLPGDWKLRGPFPWPDDQGSLAELIATIGRHYDNHTPDLREAIRD
ncbi:MAG: DinB family protein [Anaerolineaceae bacterium]|nr:DinB family protein [Anaerolineaceae bacterium]